MSRRPTGVNHRPTSATNSEASSYSQMSFASSSQAAAAALSASSRKGSASTANKPAPPPPDPALLALKKQLDEALRKNDEYESQLTETDREIAIMMGTAAQQKKRRMARLDPLIGRVTELEKELARLKGEVRTIDDTLRDEEGRVRVWKEAKRNHDLQCTMSFQSSADLLPDGGEVSSSQQRRAPRMSSSSVMTFDNDDIDACQHVTYEDACRDYHRDEDEERRKANPPPSLEAFLANTDFATRFEVDAKDTPVFVKQFLQRQHNDAVESEKARLEQEAVDQSAVKTENATLRDRLIRANRVSTATARFLEQRQDHAPIAERVAMERILEEQDDENDDGKKLPPLPLTHTIVADDEVPRQLSTPCESSVQRCASENANQPRPIRPAYRMSLDRMLATGEDSSLKLKRSKDRFNAEGEARRSQKEAVDTPRVRRMEGEANGSVNPRILNAAKRAMQHAGHA